MVSTLAAMLVHDKEKSRYSTKHLGKPLQLTTPIKDILKDDFELEDKYAEEQITIEDALSHRSGIDGRDDLYGAWLGDEPGEITRRLRYLGPLDKPFRTTYQYNNLLYATVGQAIETLTETKIDKVIKNWLWSPLGMDSSFWHLREVLDAKHIDNKKHMSRGYYWIEPAENRTPQDKCQSQEGFHTPDPFIELAGISSAGATISSVSDYVKWIKALIMAANSAKSEPGQVVSQTVFQETTRPRTIVSSVPVSPVQPHMHALQYAQGWGLVPLLGGYNHPIIMHSGGLTGYGTQLYVLPNDHFGIVTMGNTAMTSNLVGEIVAATLIARKIGLTGDTREKFQTALRSPLRMRQQPETDTEKVTVQGKPAETEHLGEEAAPSQEQSAAKTDPYIPDPGNFIKPEHSEKELLKRLQGIYENPAWGRFEVSFRNVENLDLFNRHSFVGNEIQRKAQTTVRNECVATSFEVNPLGKRTWKYKFLLHPRKPEAEETSKGSTHVHFFDFEYASGHGNVEDDSAPGIPTGCEKGPTDKCRLQKVWESRAWREFGAAFVAEPNKGDVGSTGPVGGVKLGMLLADKPSGEGMGTDTERWQRGMTWFERV